MDNLRISHIINNIALQINGNQENKPKEEKDFLKDSIFFLDQVNNSIGNKLSQSVFDLVNCCICLNPAKDPLTCPKCNNFACKECLEKYFSNVIEKRCPLCKQLIKLKELKENKVIKEIEEILEKEGNNKNKFEELSKLIIKKKENWENETNNTNNLIEKLCEFQDELSNYKSEYEFFFTNMKTIIDNTFEEFNQKIQTLINSLLSYNKVIDDSVNKYSLIYKKNQENSYNNNIKILINEILSLERRKFNDKTHFETHKLLDTAVRIVPSINTYNVKEIKLRRNDFCNPNKMTFKGNHFKVGDFILEYNFNNNNPYKISCKLNFILNDNYKKRMCFMLYQFLKCKDLKEKLIPMKLIDTVQKKYSYECQISCEDFFNQNENEVSFKTEAMIFTL